MSDRFSTGHGAPLFIVNRRAGGFRRDPRLLDAIVRVVGTRGRVIPTTSPSELAYVAREAVNSEGPVVLCGGDGTYLAALTALTRAADGGRLPRLVLGRAGTVSIAVRNWSDGAHVAALAHRVVARPESLTFVKRPTLAVTGDSGPASVGLTFGTGLVASFFEEYEARGASGNALAVRIAARTFADSVTGGPYARRLLTPRPCTLAVDDAVLAPRAWSLVVVSVLRDVGLRFRVNHRAAEDPRRPHVVASPLPPRALGQQVFRVLRGLPLTGDGNFDGLVERLQVTFPDRDGAYVLDGDRFAAKDVTVTAGPEIHVAT